MSTSADASKSYIHGWIARVRRDGHGRNTQMDELRHMAIRLLHVRSFPTIPGSKESANNWARTTLLCCKSLVCGVENVSLKMYQLRLRELGVKNAHLQFPHTRATATLIRYLSKPRMCGVHRNRLCMVLGCESGASEANRLSKRGVWGQGRAESVNLPPELCSGGRV